MTAAATSNMLAAALDLAGGGVPVFPLHSVRGGACTCSAGAACRSPGKHPRTEHGFDDATVDAAQIREWWSRWPDANIGLPTGGKSGLVVLDVDPRHGGDARLAELEAKHGKIETRTHRTGGGGQHFLFAYPAGAGDWRKEIVFGLDIKADGGYIVAPPSNHELGMYAVERDVPIADMPAWLLALAEKAPPPERQRVPSPGAPATAPGYGARALADEVARVRQAVDGSRNNTLNVAAFNLAQLVAGRVLDEGTVKRELLAAALAVELGEAEATATIRSGFAAGGEQPRTPPVRRDDLRTPATDVGTDQPSTPPPPTAAEELAALAQRPPVRRYSTGWPELDAFLDGGLYARQLAVVAAPTGAGKTGFALAVARALAQAGVPVLYISTEIEPDEIAARVAAQAIGIRPSTILRHETSPGDAARAIADVNIRVAFLDAYAIADPIAHIRELAAAVERVTGQVPVIFVDYAQQLVVEDPERRRVTVGRVASELRRMAQTLDTAVLAVSAVSRAYYGPAKKALEAEQDPRAWLASAKESGDVEYSAAAVIYLDVGEADDSGVAAARAIVAKSRRGKTGMIGMRFHGPTGSWTADVSALEAVGPARREADVDRKVLEAVKSLQPGRPRRQLRALVAGVGVKAVDESLVRLLAAGDLIERAESRPNARGQMRPVNVIAMPEVAE